MINKYIHYFANGNVFKKEGMLCVAAEDGVHCALHNFKHALENLFWLIEKLFLVGVWLLFCFLFVPFYPAASHEEGFA